MYLPLKKDSITSKATLLVATTLSTLLQIGLQNIQKSKFYEKMPQNISGTVRKLSQQSISTTIPKGILYVR